MVLVSLLEERFFEKLKKCNSTDDLTDREVLLWTQFMRNFGKNLLKLHEK